MKKNYNFILFCKLHNNNILIFMSNCYNITQLARKFKKVQAKKLVKSNKSISRIIFVQIPFFAISNMAKNQFLK